MGLILDTSALVAWERALNAGQTVAIDDKEDLIMPPSPGPKLSLVSASPIPPREPPAAWRALRPCAV